MTELANPTADEDTYQPNVTPLTAKSTVEVLEQHEDSETVD